MTSLFGGYYLYTGSFFLAIKWLKRALIQLCVWVGNSAAVLALLITVVGCASEQQAPRGESAKASDVWHVVHYDQGYWDPNKTADASDQERTAQFFGRPVIGWEQFCVPYYQELLSRLHEPSLFQQRTNGLAQEYRLLYLPSWSPPLVLRFYRDQKQTKMKFYAWAGPNAPGGEEPFMTTIRCSDQQWSAFLKQLQSQRFWELSSPRDMPQIKDGCRLVLEVLDHGRYRMVHNHEGEDAHLEAICMTLLDWVPVERGNYSLQLRQKLAQMLAQQRQASSAKQNKP